MKTIFIILLTASLQLFANENQVDSKELKVEISWLKILVQGIVGVGFGYLLYIFKDLFDQKRIKNKLEEEQLSKTRFTSYCVLDMWEAICGIKDHFHEAFKGNDHLHARQLINKKSLNLDLKEMEFVLGQARYLDLFNKINKCYTSYNTLKHLVEIYNTQKNELLNNAVPVSNPQNGQLMVRSEPKDEKKIEKTLESLKIASDEALDATCMAHKMLLEYIKKRYESSGIKSEIKDEHIKYDIYKSIQTE